MAATDALKRVHMVVGDVHGCLDALLQVEDQVRTYCSQNKLSPFFIMVGDLLDRGDHSLEVVRHVMRGVRKKTHLSLAGNHEAIFLELVAHYCPGAPQNWVRGANCVVPLFEQHADSPQGDMFSLAEFADWRKQSWLVQGGLETLRSFGQSEDENMWDFSGHEAELRFLASLPLVYTRDDLWVSHALARPESIRWARDIESTEPDYTRTADMERAAVLSEGRQLRTRMLLDLLWARDPSDPWPEDCPVHVSGHTPYESVMRLDGGRRVQLDTGCVYGNVLTAWCPETGAVFSASGPEPKGTQGG
jgi:hypothetical protein